MTMKNKIAKKSVKAVVLAATITAAAAVLAAFGGEYSARADVVWQNAEIAENYVYGEEFIVPERSFKIGNNDYNATATVVYPDGGATKSKVVKLDEVGKWTVVYSAEVGGKVYADSVEFNVNGNAYTMKNELSSAIYGRYTNYGADSEGLKVRLAMNDEITFEKVLDASEITSGNVLVSGFVSPDRQGNADFNRLIFKLTDIEDESNYVYFEINRWKLSDVNGLNMSYILACGDGQTPEAYNPNTGELHVNNGIGYAFSHSFVAQKNDERVNGWSGPSVDIEPDRYTFNIAFDNSSKAVFINNIPVIDLDDAKYFGNFWYGFKSGKVKFSASAKGYNSATANFVLTEVFGIDLKSTVVVDKEAPEINVDNGYDEMPEAIIGKAYPVPSATAKDDVSGVCDVSVGVYYNYASSSPVAVTAENGKFTPERQGIYSIVYTAKDRSGNTAREILNVHAGNEVEQLKAEVPNENELSVKAGLKYIVNAPIITGGSGNKVWSATAKCGKTELDATDGFIPETAGVWRITYSVNDYAGSEVSVKYDMEVKANDVPVLPENIPVPSVMISGSEYTFPEIFGKDYSSGKREDKLAEVVITNIDGEEIAAFRSGEKFAYDKSGEIFAVYKCGDAESEKVLITVVDPWRADIGDRLNFGEFFVGEGFSTEVDDDGVWITADREGDITWRFSNAQIADGVSVVFAPDLSNIGYSGIGITFIDGENPFNKFTIRFDDVKTKTNVSVGGNTFAFSKLFSSEIDNRFKVSFSGGKLFVDGTTINVNVNDFGEQFGGFTGEKVYVDFTTYNTKVGGRYRIASMTGFSFNSYPYDNGKPVFSYKGNYGGTYERNSTYTVCAAVAMDSLCPDVSATVTVRNPNGDIVTDISGVYLDNVDASKEYKIRLTEFGQYRVLYKAEELNWSGNSATSSVVVNVLDTVAPEITISSPKTAAKVGDIVVVPKIIVSDDNSSAENITVTKFVVSPDGKLSQVFGNSFRCDSVGTYEVRIIASDEIGNTSFVRYTVEVK